jgi:hypothetical protein
MAHAAKNLHQFVVGNLGFPFGTMAWLCGSIFINSEES